jgi:type VI secretion system secreted protein VgrG
MGWTSVDLGCEALPPGFHVVRAHGIEEMNALSRWEVRVLCVSDDLDFDALIGASAAIRLADSVEETSRTVGLVITEVIHEEEDRDGHHFTLALAPAPVTLTLRSGYRVFQKKTVKEIVEEVLKDAGLPADRMSWRLAGTYVPRPYCVQYGETEWAFIERLLADEGISYWFDTKEDGTPLIVFGDAPTAHDGLIASKVVAFEDGASLRGRRFFALERLDAMVTSAVHVRDFDVRAPEVPIEGKAGEGGLEYFEYPANVLTSDAAKARAKVRLEQLRRLQVEVHGASDCARVQAGRVVTIEGCADDWHNGDFVVLRVEHDVQQGTPRQADVHSYGNRTVLVPYGEVFARPPLPTSVPKVEGFEPGITTGPAGQEIHVDDLGRVKIRFPWDRSGVVDDTSSYWVRSLQMNLTGSMLLPRVGWEVPVAYLDGNPDKPFVLGRVYNGNSVVPYSLPGASATTTFQSATSPGGGSTTEIRMGDGAGKQEIFIHAAKDQTVVVGGAATTDVSVDATHDVTLTLSANVTASQTTSVGASQSVNVGTNYGLSISGSRTEMIGGMELVKVTANRIVSSAAYTELIGAFYGIQCNQSNTSVKGPFTQLVGGSLAIVGGLGVSETILAARTELVGGSKSLAIRTGASETVIGAKIVTAGACRETAGGKISTGSKAAGKVTIGGSATMTSSSGFAIEAPTISIEAASLSAKALGLSGGALHAKDGKTHVKATTIKRTSGGALG